MRFRFNFTGRQARAIGITYPIWDTYEAKNLGQALHKLHTDYEHISKLRAWDTTKTGIGDTWDSNQLDPALVSETDIEECTYPRRETSPNTGTYRYYRMDAPTNYKW